MSSQVAQLQESNVKAQCKTLRMPTMASQFGTLAEQAIREKKSHIGYLETLLLAEIDERERNTLLANVARARRTCSPGFVLRRAARSSNIRKMGSPDVVFFGLGFLVTALCPQVY